MAPSVRRIVFREGRVRGTLFLPSTEPEERLPLVVTMYGGIHKGCVIEERAAMLAGKGELEFLTLSCLTETVSLFWREKIIC